MSETARVQVPGLEDPSLNPPNYRDIRGLVTARYNSDPKLRKKVGPRAKRAPEQITAICFHQTAVEMGTKPRRYVTLGAHFAVPRDGQIVHCHDIDRIVWHGNGWNARSIGIEFDGRFEGIEGQIKTLWKYTDPARTPQKPTDPQEAAGLALCAWLVVDVARRGGQIKFLVSHRQSSLDRRADPGSAVWKRIALPSSQLLGLTDGGPGFHLKDRKGRPKGRPTPEAWDGSREGIPY